MHAEKRESLRRFLGVGGLEEGSEHCRTSSGSSNTRPGAACGLSLCSDLLPPRRSLTQPAVPSPGSGRQGGLNKNSLLPAPNSDLGELTTQEVLSWASRQWPSLERPLTRPCHLAGASEDVPRRPQTSSKLFYTATPQTLARGRAKLPSLTSV